MKKLIMVLFLLFASFPVFAFVQGNALFYGTGSVGWNTGQIITPWSEEDKSIRFYGTASGNAEIFLLDFLSISGGVGLGAKKTAVGLIITNPDTGFRYSAVAEVNEYYMAFPFIARLHLNIDGGGSLFCGLGLQHNNVFAANYKITNDEEKEILAGDAEKSNELLSIFELGGYVNVDQQVYFGVSFRWSSGVKTKQVIVPTAMIMDDEFNEYGLNLSVGIMI